MTDQAHYRLLATALPNEEKRIRSSFFIPTLVLVVALSSVLFVALGIRHGATPKSMTQYGLIMLAYLAYLTVWYPRRARRRLIKCWETYDLEIGRDYLVRRQADIPDLRLKFDEVQAVEHIQGRYLRVIGNPRSRVIAIPEGIDRFDQVLETISSIRPVRVRTIEQWHKYLAFMAAGLLLFVIMLWATSPATVVPLSLAMGSVIVWVFFWIRRSPNIPESQKRIAWIYWLFFLVCILKLLAGVSPFLPQQNGGYAIAGTLLCSPSVLLIVGWVGWWRHRSPRYWRNYVIACGLAATSISALCLYGVLLFVQLAHINPHEHRPAMAGVYVGWPLSVFSVVAAFVGEGRSRVMLGLAAAALVTVWTIAFH